MRPGVRLGIDVGSVRVGVAASDPSGVLATPVETVRRGRGDLDRIADIAVDRAAVEVLVGLPRSLSGRAASGSATDARGFAVALARRLAPVPVRLVDERLSTVAATADLRSAGVRGPRARQVVDQAAAVVLLQAALDTERSSDRAPGEPVPVQEGLEQ